MIYTYIYRTVYNLFSFLFGKQMEIKIPNPSSLRRLLLSFLLFKHKAVYTHIAPVSKRDIEYT